MHHADTRQQSDDGSARAPARERRLVVVGGTGMLRPAVHTLVERGTVVYGVARRPGRGSPSRPGAATYIPVVGDWTEPGIFVDAILGHVRSRPPAAPVDGALIWVHSPHRQAVLAELERVLAHDATVIQVWGSATQDPREVRDLESSSHRSWTMRHVYLGYRPGPPTRRWLTDDEVSRAALLAWDDDDDVIAGQLEPWEQHP